MRRLVKLKTRELKNVRRLAQEVLLQRSDVETFLLSSLHQVRKEVERGSLGRAGVGMATGGGEATAEVQRLPRAASGRLDVKELPWEDRERILRLLFAKINNQSQQAHFSNLPQHPLEQPSTAGAYSLAGGSAGMYGLLSTGAQADLA